MCYILHAPIDAQSDRPSLIECIRFRGKKRRINIPQEVGVKYYDFGLFLLEDDTGARIQSIAHKHMNDAEQINMEVLRQWITGRGKHPVNWTTLIEILHDIELTVLAGEIEAVKCHENEAIGVVSISDDPVQRGLLTTETADDSEQRSTRNIPTMDIEDVNYCGTLEQTVNVAADVIPGLFNCEDSKEKGKNQLDRNFEAEILAINNLAENQRNSVPHWIGRTDTKPLPLIQDEVLD